MPVATGDSLTGFGVAPQLASLLGANPVKTNGAANNSQTGAAILISRNTELNPQSTLTSFVPPASAGVMEPYFLVNPQSTTARVYVPSGHTLTSVTTGGSNGYVSVATGTSVIFWQYKPKFWAVNLSAVA